MRLARAVLMLATAASIDAQHAKPNFTGTYELDRSASRGLGGRAPAARTLTVEHSEPRIKYVYRSRNRTEEFTLITDGTDQVRDEPKGESRMSARWDGDVLEIRSYRKSQAGEATTSERWSLERDGIVVVRNPAPAEESRILFRRKH